VRDAGNGNLNTKQSSQVVTIDTVIYLEARVRQEFRARNYAILLPYSSSMLAI